MAEMWEIMENYLYFINKSFDIRIHAFVLMSNHFHLLASSPEANLSEAMNYFMRETSRSITKSSERINQTYGSRFFRSRIDSHHHFLTVYKYIYRNPIHSGLVGYAEDYEYSTLRGLLGLRRIIIPVEEDLTLFTNLEKTLAWINKMPREGYSLSVSKALKKKIFTLQRFEKNKKAHPLEHEIY